MTTCLQLVLHTLLDIMYEDLLQHIRRACKKLHELLVPYAVMSATAAQVQMLQHLNQCSLTMTSGLSKLINYR